MTPEYLPETLIIPEDPVQKDLFIKETLERMARIINALVKKQNKTQDT